MQGISLANGTKKPTDWKTIEWKRAYRTVRNLRQRIFRATQEGNLKKVRSLQKLMLKSYSNRLVSVRRVTQTNTGKKTPGMDGMVVNSPAARGKLVDALGQYTAWKAKPARRIYIPKANKKLRPLGIPVVIDRCLQAMVKNALEPAWEAKFEGSSYGFRPGRSGHHAELCVKPRLGEEGEQRGYYRHRLFPFVSRKEKAMPVPKHKPITSSPEGSTSKSSSSLAPEQEEFRQHLRRLAVSAVQVLLEQVMREELDESHWRLVGGMYAHAPRLSQRVLHARSGDPHRAH